MAKHAFNDDRPYPAAEIRDLISITNTSVGVAGLVYRPTVKLMVVAAYVILQHMSYFGLSLQKVYPLKHKINVISRKHEPYNIYFILTPSL